MVLQFFTTETQSTTVSLAWISSGCRTRSVRSFLPVYKPIFSFSTFIGEGDLEGAGHGHPVTMPVHQPCRGSPGQPRSPRLHIGHLLDRQLHHQRVRFTIRTSTVMTGQYTSSDVICLILASSDSTLVNMSVKSSKCVFSLPPKCASTLCDAITPGPAHHARPGTG